jgi:cysteine desulfurase family protein
MRPVIYLDNAATSFPKAPGVADAVSRSLRELPGSAGRASHAYAREASEVLYDARARLSSFIGAASPGAAMANERLVFTKSATEALNLAILGLVPSGGLVVASDLEHNAVMRPLRYLEAERGLRLVIFHCDPSGRPDPRALAEALDHRPDLLVLSAASNVTGALPPLAEVSEECARKKVPLLVDGSQLVGHLPLSVSALGLSLFAFSGHKGLLGPGGTGALWTAPGVEPEPLIRGGTGSASESETQPDFLPDRYEAGTQNIAALEGLGAALAYIESESLSRIASREKALVERLYSGLLSIPGVSVSGPPLGAPRAALLSFVVEGLDSGEVARALDQRGIACRMGLHCAPAAHKSAGTFERGGSIRLSPGYFTTEGEIDETIAALKEILK